MVKVRTECSGPDRPKEIYRNSIVGKSVTVSIHSMNSRVWSGCVASPEAVCALN
jgi:hypothetical protein